MALPVTETMSIQQEVIRRLDIVDYIGRFTDVHLSGNNYNCRCPIHGSVENKPMTIYPHTQSYYCFACESGGNIINFVADLEHTTYRAALEKLAVECNLNLENNEEYQKEKKVEVDKTQKATSRHKRLDDVREYMHKRGFTDETLKAFMIGADKGNIIIPIRNENGQYVAIATRFFDRKPKYLNSRNNAMYDKSRLLFNMDLARRMTKEGNELYLVEGYMDAMSGYQMGVATVGYCGNEIHKDQVALLKSMLRNDINIVYCPDNDREGLKRVPKVRETFRKNFPRANVYVAQLPEEVKDMNDLLVAGIDARALNKVHIDVFCVDVILDKQNQTAYDEYNIMHSYVNTIVNPMVKADVIAKLSERWGRNKEELHAFFDSSQEDSDELVAEGKDILQSINQLKEIIDRGSYATGFTAIDSCIGGGISKTDVCILGAYSSSGKTSFLVQYIINQIIQHKSRVALFSLEMSAGAIMRMFVAKILGCRLVDVNTLLANDDPRLQEIYDILEKYLIIYDKPNQTIYDIENRVQALNRKQTLGGDIDIICVDYFGYMANTTEYAGVAEQAKYMKTIAKNNNCIVFMLSQMNRSATTYNEPTMSQLKGGGDIEATGDYIFLMWRPEKEPGLSLEEKEKLHNITRIKVEKGRMGTYDNTLLEYRFDVNTSRLV